MNSNSLSNPELWRKIDQFDLQGLGGGMYFKKLLVQYNWPRSVARKVIKEYKKFMYLAAVSDKRVSPPLIIDKAWHTHLTFTENYWDDFCTQTLGKKIHHHPSQAGSTHKERDYKDLKRTMQDYEREFGTKPPKLIWGNTLRRMIVAGFYLGIITLIALVALEYISAEAGFITLFAFTILYGIITNATLLIDNDGSLFTFTSCGSCSSSDGDGGGCGGCGD